VFASVTVCCGDAVLPVPTVMLPAVTFSVSKMIVLTVLEPDGLVGSGDGAPEGAAKLVVTLTDVPDAIVVFDPNMMLALHEPRGGYVTCTFTAKFEMVPELEAVVVLHGNVAAGEALALADVVGLVEGLAVALAVLVGAAVGADPDDEPPPQPAASARSMTLQKSVFISGRAYASCRALRIPQMG
jgi:hypothetical protein